MDSEELYERLSIIIERARKEIEEDEIKNSKGLTRPPLDLGPPDWRERETAQQDGPSGLVP